MASFRRRSSVQDLPPSESLCCKLCLGLYNQPKLLSCLHSFCFNCLQSYTVKRQENLCVQCPSCMEYTNLNDEGVEGLTENTILERCIQRNVKKFENASELSQNAVRNIQPSVSMDGETSMLVYEKMGDNSVDKDQIFQCRHDLQHKLASLQNEAVNIVYTIDNLNEDNNRRYVQKSHVQEQIHGRAKLLIEMVKRIERKLIGQLESQDHENSVVTQTQQGKAKLHQSLRKVLSLVDFIRLLLSSAGTEDILGFQNMVDEKYTALSNNVIHLERTDPIFEVPESKVAEAIEILFGSISVKTDSVDLWSYGKHEDQSLLGNIFDILKHSNPENKKHVLFSDEDIVDGEIRRKLEDNKSDKMSKSWHNESQSLESMQKPPPLSKSDLMLSDEEIMKKCTNLKTKLIKMDSTEMAQPPTEKEEESITATSEDNSRSYNKTNSTYNRVNSGEYLRRRANRRHTVSAIQDEIKESDHRWKKLFPTLQPKSVRQTTRQLNDELQSTRNMMNICKRRLAEAKTSILQDDTDVYLNREEPALMPERFEQLRNSIRLKSNRPRSYSADFPEQ